MTTDRRLLTVRDVADRLAMSESMVRTMARTGTLPGFRIGTVWRFSPQRVEAYVAALDGASGARPQAIAAPLTVEHTDYPPDFAPIDFEAVLAKEAR